MKKNANDSREATHPAKGLGLGMQVGEQDVALSNQDSVVTVNAEPDLDVARAAFDSAAERAANTAKYLDFSSDVAATSSMYMLVAIFDEARRTADLSLMRQYEHELAQIDRRKASYDGELEKLTVELGILEDELASLEG